jgi:hypothetical protein
MYAGPGGIDPPPAGLVDQWRTSIRRGSAGPARRHHLVEEHVMLTRFKVRTASGEPIPITSAGINCRLGALGALAEAACDFVGLTRHWLPVQDDRLARGKDIGGEHGTHLVWNAAKCVNDMLYSRERFPADEWIESGGVLDEHDQAARAKGGPGANYLYDQVALAVAWPVNWDRVTAAVADLARRHDDQARHLGWLGSYLGGRLPKQGMRPEVEAVAPDLLDLLEAAGQHLQDVVNQVRRVGADQQPDDGLKLPSDETPQKTGGHLSARACELLLSEGALLVANIARQENTSLDNKLRSIARLDKRYYAWDSEVWAEFFGVTPGAIRRTKFWRVDRKQYMEAE